MTIEAAPVEAPAGGRSPLLVGALVTVYIAWGSTYLAVKVMVEDVPPLVGSGTRALAAGGLLAIGVAASRGRQRLHVTRAELGGCAAIGLLLPVAGQGLVTVAEDHGAPSGLTALLVAGVPLWVVCIRALAGDRAGPRTTAGVVIGFGGVALLVGDHGIHGSAPTGPLLLVVLSSMSWALGSWLQPRLRLPADPFVVVVYEMLVGGVMLCVLGAAQGERYRPWSYPPLAWTAWAFLVLVGSVLALTAYNWLLRTTSVSLVATYAYVNPVIAVWLGWLVLGEPVSVTALVGAAVVLAGVVLVAASERSAS